MGDDELATVRTLEVYREMIAEIIRNYSGRVVDSPGDNVLAEFSSVVDAVECAVEIQKDLKAKNEELPEDRRMEFRIGINLGDVIEEGERIYGDGVNVAARIEGLAEGGGICISRNSYEQVKNKLTLGYEYLGEHAVKNISEPVRVYRVLTEPEAAGKVRGEERARPRHRRWAAIGGVAIIIVVAVALVIWNYYLRHPPIEPASVERMAFPLPDKPSIAVLPFDNLSGDPEQDYLPDGITENIISVLSKIPQMFVIARNSTFTYKGQPVKIQEVSEDLGVRYVLEGSVQKSDNRVRITAQLIDATAGHHLWSERYDRNIKDLFDLQDEIAKEIVVALQVELTEGEQARVWHRTTDNLEAWGHAVRGYSLFERYNKADNAKARELFERALEIAPKYAYAWTMLAWTHWVDARFGFTKSRSESFKRSAELAQKAVALDDTQPDVHALLGSIHLFRRQYEEAIAEGEKAIALGPNNSEIHALLAMSVHYAGRFEEAISLFKSAIRLSPYYPSWYLYQLAESYYMTGRYEEALATFKQGLEYSKKRGRKPFLFHVGLSASYIRLGQGEKAQAHAEEVLKINPKFSLEYMQNFNFYKDPADQSLILNSLRKAGIPKTPPLPLPDKPSIAVLPFVNMSDDPEQEYFSDGITEEIITALSKTPKLFIIARSSSFTYKGKSVWIPSVGRELGVRYVLEGSVRKAGDQVRITAQLIDAKKNHHLWAERYDRNLTDVFAIQDEITMKIITALQVELTEGETAHFLAKGTNNLEAYIKILKATEYLRRWNKEANANSRQLSKEAIELDPKYHNAYRMLAWTHMADIQLGLSKSPRQSLKEAFKLVQKALDLDESDAPSHSLLGFLYTVTRQYEKAISEGEQAIELSPNLASAYAHLSRILHYAGRYKESITLIKKALRLDPIPPDWFFLALGSSYQFVDKSEEAVEQFKKILRHNPDDLLTNIRLAAAYSQLDRKEEARAAAAEVLRLNPKFSVEYIAKKWPYKNQADKDLITNALRKAGLK
jgi:adenylate cyclase